jgi:hypothetical protein
MGDTEGVLATLQPDEETEPEMDLPSIQRRDEDLAAIIEYLEIGILPSDEKVARTLVLSKSQYVLEDDVLYKVEQDSTLRVIHYKFVNNSLRQLSAVFPITCYAGSSNNET